MCQKTNKRWCHVFCRTLLVGYKKLCLNLLQLNSVVTFVVSLFILYSAMCRAGCSPRSGVRHIYGKCERKDRFAASRAEGIVFVLCMFTTAMYKLVRIQLQLKDFSLY
jgi:hypothetical protein